MAITEEQQAMLDDIGAREEDFYPEVLDRNFARALAAYPDNDPARVVQAKILSLIQLRAVAMKLNDYKQNETTENRSQIFRQIDSVLKDARAELQAILTGDITISTGMVSGRRPPRHEFPIEER